MRIRRIMAAAVVALTSGMTGLALAGSAQAQVGEPCPPAQPDGRPAGRPSSPPRQPADRPPQYPPGKCELRLSQSVVAAGGSLQAAGAGFVPGSTVEVSLSGAPVPLASTTADRGGAFSTTLEIPASTPPGSHTVTASGGAQVLSASLEVTPAGSRPRAGVEGSNAQAAGQNLPRTGSSSPLPLAVAGGTLLALGMGAVVVARRRSAAAGTGTD